MKFDMGVKEFLAKLEEDDEGRVAEWKDGINCQLIIAESLQENIIIEITSHRSEFPKIIWIDIINSNKYGGSIGAVIFQQITDADHKSLYQIVDPAGSNSFRQLVTKNETIELYNSLVELLASVN